MQGFQNSLECGDAQGRETRYADWTSALENHGCPGLMGVEHDWGSSGRAKGQSLELDGPYRELYLVRKVQKNVKEKIGAVEMT